MTLRGAVLGAIVALSASGARAQDASEVIRGVISDQMEAFEAGDVATAFTFASPGIKRMFGTADRFGAMVREGYPMVWRPGSLRFAELREEGGRTVQSVIVTDQAGAPHVLDYEMVPEGGGWQIDGVTVRRPGDAGA